MTPCQRIVVATNAVGVKTSRSRGCRPRLRPPVGVLLSRFPLITETFILREIVELERQGQPVRLVPLLRERPAVMHPQAATWVERALFTPYLSGPIVRANLRALLARPGEILGLLGRLLTGSVTSINFLLRTLALFPKSVYLAERLQDEGIRHIHAHFATHPTTVALVISELSDITFSFTVHAHDLFVRRQLLDWKLARARWVRVISEFNREYLLDRYPELSPQKLRMIHTGVDSQSYRPTCPGGDRAGSIPKSAPERPPTILCIAALQPYKGLAVLITACGELRRRGLELSCLIVGQGPLRGRLRRLIRRLDLEGSVQLLGAIPQHEVADLLARSELVVQPSVVAADGQMEGIPVSLMEAMASGKPVVASRLSGIPELVEHGENGLLVTPGSAAELALAMERLLRRPASALAMGERGRQKVRDSFELSANVDKLLSEIDRELPGLPELDRALDGLSDPRLDGASQITLEWLQSRADSLVAGLRLRLAEEDRSLVLKVHRSLPTESRPAAERAHHEWRVLEKLHETARGTRLTGSRSFAAPRPVVLVEPAAALMMESIAGTALTQAIRRARLLWSREGYRSARDAVAAVGAWLRVFQRAAGLPETDIRSAGDAMKLGVADHLQQIPELDSTACASILERLTGLLDAADGFPDAVRPQHGDLWPGNILLADERIVVLDFEAAYSGLVHEDAAYFLLHLQLFLDYPLLRRRRRRLERAFLETYLEGDPVDESYWSACRVAAAARILRYGNGIADGWLARRRRRLLLEALGEPS